MQSLNYYGVVGENDSEKERITDSYLGEPATQTAALRLSLGRSDKPGLGFALCVAMLAMLGPFTIDMIFPGFPQIGEDFSAHPAALQQITSAYLLSFAVMSIFHGPLSDALGRKKVMTAALVIYLLSTLGAALSPNLGVLIAFRILQGLSAGGATIISRVVIRDLYSGATAQKLMSQVMIIFALAPAIAPIVGGWVLAFGPWRWIFIAMLLYALIAMAVMWFKIPETLPLSYRQPFNAKSIFASILRVTRNQKMWLLVLTATASQSFFMYISAAPIIVPEILKLGEQDYWVLFVPMILGLVTGNYIVGRVAYTVSKETLITASLVVMALAHTLTAVVAWLVPPFTSEIDFWILIVMIGPALSNLGAALMMSPIQLKIMDMYPLELGAATSLSTFMLLLTAAAMAGLITPLLGASLSLLALGSLALVIFGAVLWIWFNRLEKTSQAS